MNASPFARSMRHRMHFELRATCSLVLAIGASQHLIDSWRRLLVPLVRVVGGRGGVL